MEKQIPSERILDVRSSAMFNIVNLKGTVNVPYEELRTADAKEIEEKIKGLQREEKEEEIYVMCRRGNDSKRAVQVLTEKGYKAVNIVGGIEKYGKELGVTIPSI